MVKSLQEEKYEVAVNHTYKLFLTIAKCVKNSTEHFFLKVSSFHKENNVARQRQAQMLFMNAGANNAEGASCATP